MKELERGFEVEYCGIPLLPGEHYTRQGTVTEGCLVTLHRDVFTSYMQNAHGTNIIAVRRSGYPTLIYRYIELDDGDGTPERHKTLWVPPINLIAMD